MFPAAKSIFLLNSSHWLNHYFWNLLEVLFFFYGPLSKSQVPKQSRSRQHLHCRWSELVELLCWPPSCVCVWVSQVSKAVLKKHDKCLKYAHQSESKTTTNPLVNHKIPRYSQQKMAKTWQRWGVGPITPRHGQYQRTFAPQTCRGLEAGSSRWLRLGTSVGRNCFLWWWLWTNPTWEALPKRTYFWGNRKFWPCSVCTKLIFLVDWVSQYMIYATDEDLLMFAFPIGSLSLSLITRVESLNWLCQIYPTVHIELQLAQ